MRCDWRKLREERPGVFALIVLGKKLRTKVGLVLVIICVADGLILWEPPFDLVRLNAWLVLGGVLILAGVGLRIAALGCLQKKDTLATAGVYSLCRHPLYLGSMAVTYGFCFLLDDWVNYVVATLYFLVFYSLTIIWEEVRLAERFGEAHRQYAEQTPLLLPLGRFRAGEFGLALAMRNGGALLIGLTVLLLVADEGMARVMHR